jgi:hypothetical protein
MTGTVIFDPLLPLVAIWGLGTVIAAVLIFAIWRGLAGWALRALAAAVLLGALANPSLQQEDRAPLSDIVLIVVDESASQRISDRSAQTQEAVDHLRRELAARPNFEVRVVPLGDAEGDAGTLLMTALTDALSEEPRARVAGVFLVTDGRAHDVSRLPDIPAPSHVLLTGYETDWDRRLIIKNAPAFAILGEPVTLTLRVEDMGAAPNAEIAELNIAIDGGTPQSFQVPIGEDIEVPLTLPHGGMNVLQFDVPEAAGEITARNNSAVVQINGVRDRLRVLLVSGEPHAGERTWRNLLKSDSAVDLVHFTILRPPEKQDGVPVSELSLIAFPTRELFLEKVDEFDLIIFDRYKRRGILPSVYLDSVRQYVEDGGAVLVAAGPDFATADSLFRSPLAPVLPASPTARVLEEGFVPQVTELGARHPVTEGLEAFAPDGGWGRWFRLVDLAPIDGQIVMQGMDERPLLMLNRVGQGRVALLASDHAWLWSRGFEGGGPQLELLRRLAHWMMKEPELEEEALWAETTGQSIRIIRRTLGEELPPVIVTGPDGGQVTLDVAPVSPGRYETTYDAPEIGLYRLSQGDAEAVIAVGPSSPKEFEETIASAAGLAPLVDARRGGVQPIEAGLPDIRTVRAGGPASGRGWLGITPRAAFVTSDVTITALLPAWLVLLLSATLAIGAWLYEGRR